MTVKEPNVVVRLWHWLTGRPRNETARETELRLACEAKDETIASLKHELREAASTMSVQQLEIELLTATNRRDVEYRRAETAAATFHRAQALRGKSEE